MVDTISPVVYGTRAKWMGALALHAAGALLGAPWGRAGALALVGLALVYGLREVFGLRIPVPQLRRQVPDWWRTYFGRPVAAFLYGAGLGIGFLTYLGHGTLVAVAAGAAATGRPGLGALVMTPFGLARGLSPLVAMRARSPEDGRRLIDRLGEGSGALRSAINALALGAIGLSALVMATRVEGGWGSTSSAALAVAFAWASAAKMTRWRRWRETLPAFSLTRPVERTALWLVPAVEVTIPAMTLLGRERAAAALALLLLGAFSAALVRARVRHGTTVPCGCFGRAVVDVRAALARNAALAALGLTALVAAGREPSWTLPGDVELIPASLAAIALLVAAGTAWRVSFWLGRSRA